MSKDNLLASLAMALFIVAATWAFLALEPQRMIQAVVFFLAFGVCGYVLGRNDVNYEKGRK